MISDIQLEAKQLQIEHTYGKKYIKGIVLKELLQVEGVEDDIQEVVKDIKDKLIFTDHSYVSKMLRICDWYCLHCEDIDKYLTELVQDLLVVIQLNSGLQIQSILGQLVHKVGLGEIQSIITLAEVVSFLEPRELVSILHPTKENKQRHMKLFSMFNLTDDTNYNIESRFFLPPSFTPLEPVVKNRQRVRIGEGNESMLMGKSLSYHEKDICLDVLNLSNAVPLSLNIELLDSLREETTADLDSEDKQGQWDIFREQSISIYKLMVLNHKNKFHIPHKPDSRGRLYCCGYQISYQGAPYKKASICFHEETVIEIPNKYKELMKC